MNKLMCTTMVLGPGGVTRSQDDRSVVLPATHVGLHALSIELKPGYLIVLLQPFVHANHSVGPASPCQSEIMMLFCIIFVGSKNKKKMYEQDSVQVWAEGYV